VPDGTVLSSEACRLLDTDGQFLVKLKLRSREIRLSHRLDRGPHTHRYSYVHVPLFHFFALTLPYRYHGLIPVPALAIREAEERNELEDRLFVMWATERNARCLHATLTKLHTKRRRRYGELWDKICRLRQLRLDLQKLIIDQVKLPETRRYRKRSAETWAKYEATWRANQAKRLAATTDTDKDTDNPRPAAENPPQSLDDPTRNV
jgi:hypothetical protein